MTRDNYVQNTLQTLEKECPDLEPELQRLYALLTLVKGPNTTLENVHDAWAIWRNIDAPEHWSVVPFDQLTPEVKALDNPYRDAIRATAAKLQQPPPLSAGTHPDAHPLAGKKVTLKLAIDAPDIKTGDEYHLEDWWDRIAGISWMTAQGNPACLKYAMRSGFANLPLDNEVVYGKVGGFGHLVHITEIDETPVGAGE